MDIKSHEEIISRVIFRILESNSDRIQDLNQRLFTSPDSEYADHYRSQRDRLQEEIVIMTQLHQHLFGKIMND